MSLADKSIWTPIRCELLKWFQEKAESLSDAYWGAVILLHDKNFPGRVHFISHAIRDISDRLVFILDPHVDPSCVQYANELDKILKFGLKLEPVENTNLNSSKTESYVIDAKSAVVIKNLIEEHKNRRERPSNFELLFYFLQRQDPGRSMEHKRIAIEFKKMRNWFMGLAHLRTSATPTVSENELQLQFEKFENMLHSFVGNFFTGKNKIDAILHQANQ